MRNPSKFQFKQFTIYQENASLKVTTDACLFGALIEIENAQTILDIGTGTGLLSLMLAQKKQGARISAIEVDEHTYRLAKKNFLESRWRENLTLLNDDVNKWTKFSDEKFKLIVCNPPFFSSSKKNQDERKSLARHNDSLSHEHLISVTKKHLADKGQLWIMLPPNEMNKFSEVASREEIFPKKRISVCSSTEKKPHLIISSFSYIKNKEVETSALIIETEKGIYSKEFIELLSPYYLHF